MKKADQIKVLQAMADNTWAVGEIFERDGDLQMAKAYQSQYFALRSALRVLTNSDYAEKMHAVFFERRHESA